MNHIKVNIDRAEVSSEEIKARRDFDSILSKYKAAGKPFYQKPYFGISIAVVIAFSIGTIFYFQNNKSDTLKSEGNKKEVAQITFINPPVKNVNIPYDKYSIDALKGGTIETSTGAFIHIPEKAFTNLKGEVVTGTIDIQYREFNDPLDFFIAGIPMKYDSAGTEFNLVSAGMIDIRGYQKNIPIKIADGKSVEIEKPSIYEGSQYNLYELDTVKGNWVFKGKDKIKGAEMVKMPKLVDGSLKSALMTLKRHGLKVGMISEKDGPFSNLVIDQKIKNKSIRPGTLIPKGSKIDITISNGNSNITATDTVSMIEYVDFPGGVIEEVSLPPVKPIKASPKKFRFDIDVDSKEFPAIYIFKEMQFEVGDENKNFHAGMYNVDWEDIKLSDGKSGKNYNATFIKGDSSFTFTVYPVYTSKDSAKVMKLYQKKYDEYKKNQWRDNLLMEERTITSTPTNNRPITLIDNDKETPVNGYTIYRVLSIGRFGIWNSDYPLKYNNEQIVDASFKLGDGQEIDPDIAYHIDKSKNTLFSHYRNKFYKFNFNPEAKNVLFVVLPNQKLAIAREDEFNSIRSEQVQHQFNLQKVEKTFNNVKELKEYLNEILNL